MVKARLEPTTLMGLKPNTQLPHQLQPDAFTVALSFPALYFTVLCSCFCN